jgi:hypothetical protein
MTRTLRSFGVALAASVLAFVLPTPDASADNLRREFTYQGVVEFNGAPLNGEVPMRFEIYDSASGGELLTSYPRFDGTPPFYTEVEVTDGVFSETLPFGTPGNLFNGRRLWIQVVVDFGTQILALPRQEITPTPFALTMPGVWSNNNTVRVGEGYNEVRVGDGNSTTDLSLFGGDLNMWLGELYMEAGGIRLESGGITLASGGICLDTDGGCTPVQGGIRVGTGGILGTDSSDQNVLILPTGGGSVGIGVSNPTEKLDVGGAIRIRGADIVEGFESSTGEAIEPGTVVSIDPVRAGRLMPSGEAYDTKVAGVVSGAGGVPYGMALAYDGQFDGETKVAMTGRVYVKCTAEAGAIEPGDLLTTASLPGHAMKAADRDRAHGTVIGKAMSALDDGTGLVLVLVNLQ